MSFLESLFSISPGTGRESLHAHNVEVQGYHFLSQRESVAEFFKVVGASPPVTLKDDMVCKAEPCLQFSRSQFRFSLGGIWSADSLAFSPSDISSEWLDSKRKDGE